MQPITQDQFTARQEALKNAKIFKFEIPEPDVGYILQILQFSPSPWAIMNPIVARFNEQITQQLQKSHLEQQKLKSEQEDKS